MCLGGQNVFTCLVWYLLRPIICGLGGRLWKRWRESILIGFDGYYDAFCNNKFAGTNCTIKLRGRCCNKSTGVALQVHLLLRYFQVAVKLWWLPTSSLQTVAAAATVFSFSFTVLVAYLLRRLVGMARMCFLPGGCFFFDVCPGLECVSNTPSFTKHLPKIT